MRRKNPGLPEGVQDLRERIEHWREDRKKRSLMPKELWDAAVSLAREHDVSPMARALGLNYLTLKKRVANGSGRERERGDASVSGSFVELNAADLLGMPESEGTVVELSDAEGARMVIHLRESSELDLVGLAGAFWKRGS